MILDRIENWSRYFAADSLAAKSFGFLSAQWKPDMMDGRHEIAGEDAFAKVERYKTDAAYAKRLESHRTYFDIQIMLEGSEIIGWLPTPGLKAYREYDEKKDIAFYHDGDLESQLILRPGLFAVFYPEDAHRPGCALRLPLPVRKIVFKVKVEG